MTRARRTPASLVALGFAAFAGALAIYAGMAWHSPVWRAELAARDKDLRALAAGAEIDMAAEAKLAEAYWTRYPDVAASAQYGEGGRLGAMGAREHFNRHGRREGRIWGN